MGAAELHPYPFLELSFHPQNDPVFARRRLFGHHSHARWHGRPARDIGLASTSSSRNGWSSNHTLCSTVSLATLTKQQPTVSGQQRSGARRLTRGHPDRHVLLPSMRGRRASAYCRGFVGCSRHRGIHISPRLVCTPPRSSPQHPHLSLVPCLLALTTTATPSPICAGNACHDRSRRVRASG